MNPIARATLTVDQAMASLKSSGIIFRHETVGFGIAPSSPAAQDLRQIATQTGGAYHHAVDANQLADVFMEFVDTFTVIDMLGMFGRGGTPAAAAARQGQPKGKPAPTTAPAASQPASGQVTSMLGLFKPKPPAPEADDRPPQPAPPGAAPSTGGKGSAGPPPARASGGRTLLPAVQQPLRACWHPRPVQCQRIYLRRFLPVPRGVAISHRRNASRPSPWDDLFGAMRLRRRIGFWRFVCPWTLHQREPLRHRSGPPATACRRNPLLLRSLGQQASRDLANGDGSDRWVSGLY